MKNNRNYHFSISSFILVLSLIAILPAGFTTYLSVNNSKDVQSRVKAETFNRERAELEREIQHLGDEIKNIAITLATWDETRILFSDSTYYNYWKETRTKNVAQYRGLIEEIDLYTAAGDALTNDYTLTKGIYKKAVSKPALYSQDGKVQVIYYHPIQAGASTKKYLGYIGISMDLTAAISQFINNEHSHIMDITWNLPDRNVIPVEQAITMAELELAPLTEVQEFAEIIRDGFTQYFLYAVMLVTFLVVLLVYSIARPLGRLDRYLRAIYTGEIEIIPDNFHGIFRIRELEGVRQTINDYKNRFQSAAKNLEEKNEELTRLTNHDPLTGRYNRRAFEARLEHAIETTITEGKEHALCYIDLDQFKVINDTCGHIAGDELLQQVAVLLEGEIRKTDMLARLGGDEFGVLLEGCDIDKALAIAESMRVKTKTHRFSWNNKPLDIGISIGLVPINYHNANSEEILKNADAACYVAKDSGRNRVQLYQEHDKEMAKRYGEMHWVSHIKQALEEDRLILYAQKIHPIKFCTTEHHYELLVRLLDDNGELVPPMAFIPAAERYNLMVDIDKWVIKNAMIQINKLNEAQKENIFLSINLSGQSIGNKEMHYFIQSMISKHNINPKKLCFEITETAAITNVSIANQFIKNLHELGCKFSLDDFGSGLSSFGYLSKLEVDYIKIDGEFIKSIESDPLSLSIVNSINQIGHVLGVETIAEFVENSSISNILASIGIDYVQGYGIHRPEPLLNIIEGCSKMQNESA